MLKRKEQSKSGVSKKFIDVRSDLKRAAQVKDYGEKIRCYSHILEKLDIHCLQALEMRAHCWLVKGEFAEALKDCDSIIAILDAMESKYEKYAPRFTQSSDYASYTFIRASAKAPKAFRAEAQIWHAKQLGIRGRLYFILGKNEEALTDFNRATALLPQMTPSASSEIISLQYDIQLGYAYTKAKQKKNAESIKHLDQVLPVLKEDWHKIQVLIARGWLKLLLNEDNGAVADFQDAYNKQIAQDKKNLNNIFYRNNPHFATLIDDVTRVCLYEPMIFAKGNPNIDQRATRFHTMECIFRWGVIKFMASLPLEVLSYRPGQELKELDGVLSSDPTCKLALHNRAHLHESLGNYVKAIEDYSKAECDSYIRYLRSLDKVRALAKQYEGEILEKYNADIQEAIKHADIGLSLNPESANILSIRGFGKAALGNAKEGLIDCNRALNLDPKEKIYFYRRAWVQQKAGYLEAAVTDYEKAIELGENVHSTIALAELKTELKTREEERRQLQQKEAERKLLEKEEALRRQQADEQLRRKAQDREELQQHKTKEERRSKQEEQAKRSDFHQALTNLKNARINNTKDSSTLNKEYQELESKAFQHKSAEFFADRGDFYHTSAQKEPNEIRKNAMYNKALQDYRKALDFDPFINDIPEKIAQIEAQLRNNASVGANRNILLAAPQPPNTTLKREELTPVELKELEKIKEQLREQKISGEVNQNKKF